MDITFKIILLGDCCVGKSSLLSLLKNETFLKSYSSTIGVDFGSIYFKDGENKYKIQIWDTGGQEKFSPLVKVYYRNATAAIVMFDLTSRGSFTRVRNWVSEFKTLTSGYRPIIVVGNKSDLFNMRVLTKKDIKEEITDRLDLPYFEISVKDSVNVDNLFDYIIKDVKRLIDDEILEPSILTGIKKEKRKYSFMLHKDSQENGVLKKQKCCTIL